MTSFRFEMNHDDQGGPITLALFADMTRERIETSLLDTEGGVELRTTVTYESGETRTVTDKVDRATPPLDLMMSALQNLFLPFATNTQAVLNRARYNRLKREGKPITVANMCLDGAHKGPEYQDKPFLGGVVGLPKVEPDEAQASLKPEERVELSDALMRDLDDILGNNSDKE